MGARIVEIDVHKTTDGRFAVFHDWTLDCRTEGEGTTRNHSLEYLKTLDVGYGYTVDGRTFPFRGRGTGMLPSLKEVMAAFPEQNFIINVKSNDPDEGELLARFLGGLSAAQQQNIAVYGAIKPVQIVHDKVPTIKTLWRSKLKSCLVEYFAYGWASITPRACNNMIIMVPINYADWLWGWPGRFVQRMRSVGSEVVVIGPYSGGFFTTGIDEPSVLGNLHPDFPGGIWTDRIDIIGPYLQAKRAERQN